MVNTSEETTVKKKATYWLEQDVRDDLKVMSELIGATDTSIVHEAIRLYKESEKFKSAVAEHQRKQNERLASFNLPTGQVVPGKIKSTAHALRRSAARKLHHKKAAE